MKEIEKPKLDVEVEVKVSGITKLENNMNQVKELAINLQEFYKNERFIEDGTILDFENEKQMNEIEEKKKIAKEEKAKINNFKNAINEKCKEALEIYNKPIENFQSLKKETLEILTNTYELINDQVNIVDSQLMNAKINKLKKYFIESCEHENIDFITYERFNQNVTLSASMKSLKKEINDFVNKVVDDLSLIETQEHKLEILIEYKKDLNVAKAITTTNERIKAIEIEKQEQQKKELLVNETQKNVEKVENILSKPVITVSSTIEENQAEVKEQLLTTTFKVTATKIKLIELRNFLEDGGYIYEQ